MLGSGGIVGQGLVEALNARGFLVKEVKSRCDLDLRREEFAQVLALDTYSFAFFLAWENAVLKPIQKNKMILDDIFETACHQVPER